MEKRQLGNSDLMVSPIAFGGNVFGWTIDKKQSSVLLDGFAGEDFNFIDTADVYSTWKPGNHGGESESIIGDWMHTRKNRKDMIIATKVGSDMGNGKKGLKKEYIIKAAEDSLKRLKTDYIDLYQTHFDDETTEVGETLLAYEQLVKDGKVRWIGASNMSVDRLRESLAYSAEHGLPSYQSFQPQYNIYDREQFENGLEPICLGNGLGVITYYSLASGFLSGKYRSEADLSQSARGGSVSKYLNERGFKILDALDQVAAEFNSTPAAVALAWLIHRPAVTAPIVSATTQEQLKSIIEAPKLDLGATVIGQLTSVSAW